MINNYINHWVKRARFSEKKRKAQDRKLARKSSPERARFALSRETWTHCASLILDPVKPPSGESRKAKQHGGLR